MIEKVLIANRGEIACRIARTARKMGVRTVAVYSDVDKSALHREACDEAMAIGGATSAESYLNREAILEAAARTDSDAIHPGYGFLSENAAFAEECIAAGHVFVGPSAHAIETMGSKALAKELMLQSHIPLVPGYHGDKQELSYLTAQAQEIGFPVLLKASAGGGGRGMRIVDSLSDFEMAVTAAKRESFAAFSDDRLLLEKFILRPRHIEVQIFADNYGNLVHLFERDCSVQRRYQKVIEEAPAPNISFEMRQKLFEAALRAASAINYRGAGTIEFIVDSDNFYFIEMNTRLQVEHSVTELITGIDLVEWQIRIASGEELPLKQDEILQSGHAIEARLYAEDSTNFQPQAGFIKHLRFPDNGARIDTGVRDGDSVSIYYDPMIAKVTVHGENRSAARSKISSTIDSIEIDGLISNRELLGRIVKHPTFRSAELHTGFIEETLSTLTPEPSAATPEILSLASLVILKWRYRANNKFLDHINNGNILWADTSGWRVNGTNRHEIKISDHVNNYDVVFSIEGEKIQIFQPFETVSFVSKVSWHSENYGTVFVALDGIDKKINFYVDIDHIAFFLKEATLRIQSVDNNATHHETSVTNNRLIAPMPAKVISIEIKEGAAVMVGEILIVLEAMKMEHSIRAPSEGIVSEIYYKRGDIVEEGTELLKFTPSKGD